MGKDVFTARGERVENALFCWFFLIASLLSVREIRIPEQEY